jgi:hypothetical protein
MNPILIPRPRLKRQTNNHYIPKSGSQWIEDENKSVVIIVKVELIRDRYHVIYKNISNKGEMEKTISLSEFHSYFSGK